MLNYVRHGDPGSEPPLVIAHGLFGSARNWGVIARRLAENREVYALDMRNHGQSPWFDNHGYLDLAEDLTVFIQSIGGGADLVGHSMGGKAAMAAAVEEPDLIRRLIVADIAPVAYSHTQLHLAHAMQELDPNSVSSRGFADDALSATITDPGVRAFLLQSLDLKDKKWRLNLETLIRDMPDILSFPSLAGSFEGPTLFLSGSDSDYVRQEHRPEIKRLFPKARFARIPGAGHWLHADKPREFEAAVRAFLAP